jgi:hypothetical protein
MAHEIDIRDGSMHLANGVVLERDASLQQLITRGVSVSRDIDMKTGWRLVSIGRSLLFGTLANLALLFFKDELKQIHFALDLVGVTNPDDVRKMHDGVLTREFGAPQMQDAQKLMYVFPWGTLVSAHDPRGGQSEVVLSWK